MIGKSICHKWLLFLILTTASFGLAAQTVTLTFTAKDAANHYVQLNRVTITNLTKSWQETIYWPDTVLTMLNGTGIDDHTLDGGFALSQNNPNPFSGTTEVSLTTVDEGKVDLDIKDMNGRIIETQNLVSLQPGNHQFRISLSTAGTYVMTARQNGKTSSIKMICNGGGGSNTLDYLGMVQTITVVLKSNTNKPFNFGDIMQYVGYGTVDGTELESSHIVQAQNSSQMFTLQFTTQGPQLPIVTTHSVTNITDVSASCGGTVNSDGGSAVTARGICWSATQNPTVSNQHTTNGSGTGSFTSNLTGLTPNITYYVRAYATNAAGTAYGQQEVFNTNPSLASVTTAAATNITISSATLGGTVTSDGGSTVTERGCCWGIHQNPTITSHYGGAVVSANNGGTGNFSVAATGLTPGTTYYVRAYATNAAGTAYGQQITFTALVNLPAVTTNSVTNISSTTATCGGNVSSDGGGTVTARGVCWSTSQSPTVSNSHTTDGNGTGSFSSSLTGLNAGSTYYVRAYATNSAGTEYGEERSFSPMAPPTVTTGTASNITCSSATISGVVTNDNGSPVTDRGFYYYQGESSQQISAGSGTGSFTCTVNYSNSGYSETKTVRAYAINSAGISYGEFISFTTPSKPVVTSLTVSNITDNSVSCVGSVTSDGGSAVTERGVYISTSPEFTTYLLNGSHHPSGSGTGSFTVNLSSLTPLTTYYVRTYATNCAGTMYGVATSFTTTGVFTCGTSTIHDYDGNVYNTVKIGSQCWMASNLRTKHYSDGVSISWGNNNTSTSTAYYYYANGNSSNGHGYLYNWKAATRTSQSSSSNPSGIQGVCPTGWHLPSKDEWIQLTDFVSDAGIYSCGNTRRKIGKALSASWASGDTCTVSVNATGFNGTKDGYFYNGNFSHYNSTGYFWSSGGNSVFKLGSTNYYAAVEDGFSNNYGLSVRCVSDESIGAPVTQRPYQAAFSSNEWTLNNGSCNNFWDMGTPYGNNRPALFIRSSSNSTYEAYYNISSPSTVMAEKVFVMPSDDSIHIEFDVQIGGENCCDYLKAFLVPASVVFTPGSSHNTQSQSSYSNYAINFAAYKSQTTAGNNYPYVLNLTNGNTIHVSVNAANPNPDGLAKFVFLWRNDNSVGTEPGAVITSFSIGRRPCPGIPTVTDYDGNVYNTLRIGDQCWMRENMRAKHYSDGTLIPEGSTTSTTNTYRYAPDNDTNNVSKYGYLYNWAAAMRGTPSSDEIPSAVQGVCPVGWHIPTSNDWDILQDYLGSQSICYCTYYDYIAKSLAHQEGWSNGGGGDLCRVCQNPNTNNASGLGFLPAGYYDGEYNDFGSSADYWLPVRGTSNYYLNCPDKRLTCNSSLLESSSHGVQNTGAFGKSIRCIQGAAAPTVTTSPFTVIDSTSAVFGGDVKSDGESPVIARGVCWSTSQKPTVSDSHTSDGNGLGVFNSTLLGLTPNTIYYVRAYATNAIGTTYGEQKSFKTEHLGEPCANATAVTDYDGNVYNILQIGAQCWMKENLRTTHYSDGTPIPYQLVNSKTSPYRYAPNNDQSLVQQYGYLYNTKAAMYNAPSSTSNPSGEQGICPIGWHLPSDSEWVQLINYLKTNQDYICSSQNEAKSLASTSGWNSSSVNCSVGNYQEYNNATGFSAYPVGIQIGTTYYHAGQLTEFFTSHYQTGASDMGYIRKLEHDHTGLDRVYIDHSSFASVRCLRDVESETYSQILPSIITVAVQDIDSCSAVCGGNISNNGSATVIERGVCWGLNHNPTTSDNHVANGNGIGSFSCNMTGLTYDMTFYARAYAVTTAGTVYGNEVSFYVPIPDGIPCPGNPTVTDYDDNTYNTVHIGTQCWMKENLRTTHFADGTNIDADMMSFPNNDSTNVSTYGYLYEWDAVMHGAPSSTSGTQGVCPNGWHVPSQDEWTQLKNYLTSHSEYWCNGNSYNTAKAVADTMGWDNSTWDCTVGNDLSTNNATGFSALPAGYHYSNWTSTYYHFGQQAYFSSSTQSDSYYAYSFYLSSGGVNVNINSQHKAIPLSVRCIYNTITTTAVTNISATTATSGGNVVNDGGAAVTARGVCWSTSQNPTVTNSHTTDGSGTGSFTSSITGLSAGTTYYVRAYATNSAGTVYGNQMNFTTSSSSSLDGQPCPGAATVSDYDGHTYNTVQIGQQCWMKQNLRTTHYANGISIPNGVGNTSYTSPYYYNNSSSNIALTSRGYLYNWPAAVHGAASSTANPSGVQGICPTGWHLPSDAEWTQLTNYVRSQSEYICGGNSGNIAKALASTSGWWTNSSSTCAVGYNQASNNTTGFAAIPAGRTELSFFEEGSYAHIWSSTENNSGSAFSRSLYCDHSGVTKYSWGKSDGLSVRCLKD